jgi:hypothetical protein
LAFKALLLSRLREFYREPEAIFWVYGFPVLLAVGLGIAFRERPPEVVRVDVVETAPSSVLEALRADARFSAAPCAGDACAQRLRLGRTDLVVGAAEPADRAADSAAPGDGRSNTASIRPGRRACWRGRASTTPCSAPPAAAIRLRRASIRSPSPDRATSIS